MPHAARGRRVDLESPRGYHLDYSSFVGVRGPRDPDGLPVAGRGGGALVYSPGVVAREALGHLEVYLQSGGPSSRDAFERAARWMIASAEDVPGSFSGWPEPSVPRLYRGALLPGWFSAASHAECMSVLVRATVLLRLDGALDACGRAVGAFDVPVEDGGFLREVGDGGQEGGLDSLAMVEEFPMEGRPSLSIAGHLRAMLALFDYRLATDDASAGLLFERLERGLEFMLDRYDTGWWSLCDLDRGFAVANLSTVTCHEEHILQLEALHRVTGSELLRATSERWKEYEAAAGSGLRVLLHRARFGLATGLLKGIVRR